MPKGVAKNPDTDKRRQTKAGGRPPTLPAGTYIKSYRATRAEHEQLTAHLAQLRAAEGDKETEGR